MHARQLHIGDRDYFVLGVTADKFLRNMACSVVGLLVAILNGPFCSAATSPTG
jgi:hypothetical protein